MKSAVIGVAAVKRSNQSQFGEKNGNHRS